MIKTKPTSTDVTVIYIGRKWSKPTGQSVSSANRGLNPRENLYSIVNLNAILRYLVTLFSIYIMCPFKRQHIDLICLCQSVHQCIWKPCGKYDFIDVWDTVLKLHTFLSTLCAWGFIFYLLLCVLNILRCESWTVVRVVK